MNDVGILFRAPLVRAILRDVDPKTATRRLPTELWVLPRRKVTSDAMPGQPVNELLSVAPPHRYRVGVGGAGAVFAQLGADLQLGLKPGEFDFLCPYAAGRTYLDEGRWHIDVAPDQRLWVRETHAVVGRAAGGERVVGDQAVRYRATWEKTHAGRWRPSIFMPRWASRLSLLVTHVRLERLQDITEDDARAEGVVPSDAATAKQDTVDVAGMTPHRAAFACLWEEINGDRASWASNPWVWALTFRRVEVSRG